MRENIADRLEDHLEIKHGFVRNFDMEPELDLEDNYNEKRCSQNRCSGHHQHPPHTPQRQYATLATPTRRGAPPPSYLPPHVSVRSGRSLEAISEEIVSELRAHSRRRRQLIPRARLVQRRSALEVTKRISSPATLPRTGEPLSRRHSYPDYHNLVDGERRGQEERVNIISRDYETRGSISENIYENITILGSPAASVVSRDTQTEVAGSFSKESASDDDYEEIGPPPHCMTLVPRINSNTITKKSSSLYIKGSAEGSNKENLTDDRKIINGVVDEQSGRFTIHNRPKLHTSTDHATLKKTTNVYSSDNKFLNAAGSRKKQNDINTVNGNKISISTWLTNEDVDSSYYFKTNKTLKNQIPSDYSETDFDQLQERKYHNGTPGHEKSTEVCNLEDIENIYAVCKPLRSTSLVDKESEVEQDCENRETETWEIGEVCNEDRIDIKLVNACTLARSKKLGREFSPPVEEDNGYKGKTPVEDIYSVPRPASAVTVKEEHKFNTDNKELTCEQETSEATTMSRRPQVLRVTDSANTLRRPKPRRENSSNSSNTSSPEPVSDNAQECNSDDKVNNTAASPVIVATFTVSDGSGAVDEHNPIPPVSPPIISKENFKCKEIDIAGKQKNGHGDKQPAFRTLSCTPHMEKKVTSSVGLSKSSYSLDRRACRNVGRSIPEYLNQLCMNEDDCEKGKNPMLASTLKIQNARKVHQNSVANGNCTDDSCKVAAFDGLMQYLQEYRHGLRELLVNNNVVIIEPIRDGDNRHENRKVRSAQGFVKEVTCRITGATVKKTNSDLVDSQRQQVSGQPVPRRHFFYHPKRANRELLDEELPDPDTVRNARKLFEKTLKMKTPSDEFNIKNDHLNTEKMMEIEKTENTVEEKPSSTVTKVANTVSPKLKSDIPNPEKTANKKKVTRYLTVDSVLRHNLGPKRWTDSGSLSSGVSSDLSCYETETDADSPSRNSSHKEDVFSSDDDHDLDTVDARNYYIDDGEDGGHYVAPEVLEKIRACGTTVTYYGGRVIASSKGPIMSPMTLAIMDEIKKGINSTKKGAGMKVFQDEYLGVKFRLVKSNSCGSRLELAGTDEETRISENDVPHHRDNNERSSEKLQPVDEVDENSIKNQQQECENISVSDKDCTSNPEGENEVGDDKKTNGNDVSGQKLFENGLGFWKRNECENIKGEIPKINFITEKNKSLLHRRSVFDEMEFEEFEVLDESCNEKSKESSAYSHEETEGKEESVKEESVRENQHQDKNTSPWNSQGGTGGVLMTSWANHRQTFRLDESKETPNSVIVNHSTC